MNAKGSVASLVLGILCHVVWIPFLNLILAILAIVTSLKAKKRILENNGELSGRGLATAGLVLGILGVVGGLIMGVFGVMRLVLRAEGSSIAPY